MTLLEKIREALPQILPTGEFDPWHGEFELYVSEACNFEVLDGGVWYMVDVMHPYPELYEDVPESVVERVDRSTEPVSGRCGSWDGVSDPTPLYAESLKREFDDVRFVNMTYEPGLNVY